jgi:hypothetical protein
MTELVTAVFEAPSTAEAAIQDLEMARIPSVVIQRGVSGDRDGNASASTWHSVADAWHNKRSRDWPSVTVAVDDIHATLVAGILNQHGPLELEERVAQSHRH